MDESASDTEVEIARETSIPVHAVPCSKIQCAPLKYRAQLKIIILCRKDFILTRERRLCFGQAGEHNINFKFRAAPVGW